MVQVQMYTYMYRNLGNIRPGKNFRTTTNV